MTMNIVTTISENNGRNYITPEDVEEALSKHDADAVRLDVLEVLGNQTPFGCEDVSLTAFVAWKGLE